MVYYVLAVLVEYAIAFGLALLLNAEIRARKFFRVVFLLPLHAQPGRGQLDDRQVDDGVSASARRRPLARHLGWDSPAFFAIALDRAAQHHGHGRLGSIPFMMILLLAGLQALPERGAGGGQGRRRERTGRAFWQVIFPLMLPVSVTAIVIRIIFKLKLADIVINVTAGGPGGATDSVSSFIYREYRDRSNVGYGTALADVLSGPDHRLRHGAARRSPIAGCGKVT